MARCSRDNTCKSAMLISRSVTWSRFRYFRPLLAVWMEYPIYRRMWLILFNNNIIHIYMLRWLFISVDGIMHYRVWYKFSVLLASWSTCFSTFNCMLCTSFSASRLRVDRLCEFARCPFQKSGVDDGDRDRGRTVRPEGRVGRWRRGGRGDDRRPPGARGRLPRRRVAASLPRRPARLPGESGHLVSQGESRAPLSWQKMTPKLQVFCESFFSSIGLGLVGYNNKNRLNTIDII